MVPDHARWNLKLAASPRKLRLAVVSPFLDKRHGTERRVCEWISGLADECEIVVYSQCVQDIDLRRITWRRIPKIRGPHLVNYLWWLAANHVWRGWDRHFRQIRADLVLSPGINCLDADVISVHIVFAEYAKSVANDLKLRPHPLARWPQLLHRKAYYRLVELLESRIYRNPQKVLVSIAQRTNRELARHYGRQTPNPVIYLGLDHDMFNPERRRSLRASARRDLGYGDDRFVLLLIGNHLVNKGLPVLAQAIGLVRELRVELLLVSRENPEEYRSLIELLGGRVQLRKPRSDVEFYYAAADAYAGPSLEDTFALPPAEAMACGLPVIVSAENGTCEIITHESDGLILQDPLDASGLAGMIRRLYEDRDFRERLGENAHKTALQYTWDRNARELKVILEDALRRKVKS